MSFIRLSHRTGLDAEILKKEHFTKTQRIEAIETMIYNHKT